MGNNFPASQMKEAKRFAYDLIINQKLAIAFSNFVTSTTKKLKLQFKKDKKEEEIYLVKLIDNFLTEQKYNCTYAEVIQAMKVMPAYQLYYWSGSYKTQVAQANNAEAKASQGETFIIEGSAQGGAQSISYGKYYIIPPEDPFENHTLTWNNSLGLNTNAESGTLTFRIKTPKKGKNKRCFYGTININGTEYNITGIETDPSNVKDAPTATNMKMLERIQLITGFAANSTFLLLNLLQIGSFLKQWRQSRMKSKEEKEKLEKEMDEKIEKGEDIEKEQTNETEEIENIPEDEFKETGQQIAGEAPSENIPEELPKAPSEEQNKMLNDEINNESEGEGGGGNEGGGGEDEGGDGGFIDDDPIIVDP